MKTVLWTSQSLQSAEYYTLDQQEDGFLLKGIVNLLLENQPTHVIYHIECNSEWMSRRVEIQQIRPDQEKRLTLTTDDQFHWYADGFPIPWATGLRDIDLSITTSTNILPIRKLDLQIGESHDVNCVWVQLPDLTLSTLPQRYTRIHAFHYEYSAPSLAFKALIHVDEEGIPITYGDLWTQPQIKVV